MSSIEPQHDATTRNATPNEAGWWRSPDQLADAPRYRAFLEAEFPEGSDPKGVSRRRWLQLMGASLALAGVAGCRWEKQEIHAFNERPDGRTPGKPRRFATAMPTGGGALGLEVTTVDGRPIKIEGNERHPQSGGATDVLAQAAILELYDPDRSRTPVLVTDDAEETKQWQDFEESLGSLLVPLKENGGERFWVLSEAANSPTIDALREKLQTTLPKMQWFEYEPLGDDNDRAGAALAFDRQLRTHLSLDAARVIVCLDADPLGGHPAAVQYTGDFAKGRGTAAEATNVLYAVEAGFSLTGSVADRRLPLRASEIAGFVGALEKALSGGSASEIGGQLPERVRDFFAAVVTDLSKVENQGQSVVCVGSNQPPEAHAAVHRINAKLGNVGKTISYTEVPQPERPPYAQAIRTLADAMRAGTVETLLILGGNPAYDAPADVAFAEALDTVETSIHLGLYRNETARRCTWHLPQAHFLETWGDVRSFDGTYSVIQPMIAPLFGGRSAIEVLAGVLSGVSETEPARPQDLVRQEFQTIAGDVGAAWRRTLRDGLLEGSEWPEQTAENPGGPELSGDVSDGEAENGKIEVVFARDASVVDGRFANNSWLQEWPDPLSKLAWGNAALIGPATKDKLGIEHETIVEVKTADRSIRAPVCVMPGVAPGTIVLPLGYGRTAAGSVGGSEADGVESVGVDVYPLRTTDAMWLAGEVTAEPTGESYPLASTQDHFAIDAVGHDGRKKRLGSLLGEESDGHHDEHASHDHAHDPHQPRPLWQEHEYTGHRWGMVIDLSKCTGCGACTVACQAENNIPVVGRDQVILGREMHWVRLDRYFRGSEDDPEVAHQPVPCQQCEMAPCEQVCPVAATVHSSEGLNDMVYNRCVGTRYCANNCPYKVRRFNYFNLHKDLDDPANEVAKLKYNPEVTVRSRGVMEKCTYCVQRIQAAKIAAKNAGREIADGEIRTACQQVCPAGAITFGDLADKNSAVAICHAKQHPYEMLAELNVRPRTTYLARERNSNDNVG